MKYTYYNILPDWIRICWITIFWTAITGCNSDTANDTQTVERPTATPVIPYVTKAIYPHDTTLFTEGLVFNKGLLYESGGAPAELPFTRSVIGISSLVDGSFTPKIEIDRSRYFGEGIVFLNNKLYQLTYKNQKGFVYDAKTFKKIDEFTYTNTEGWGMTTDGNSIIMSDGTEHLTFLDPNNYKPVRTLKITENGMVRDSLNELEYINGFVYANVWQHPEIVKIDMNSGEVVGKLNLTSIVNAVAARKPGSLK
ncbi:glutaminyl-peptide cyclotransferase [Niabella hibiscisoli]|uniref:glutaminyl-peptide cyclotransferase n=1 Tax=Niabella hibiscisoli TaxID=1825928 RepID=UPI001F0F1BBA|nr:glutaminyl-peptide cyclotransferase [Niabella hibiscisoli]MCH5714836.1 glutaminyl-peptide cyclotransferase [Niabella hibiscisoli]